MKIKWLGHACFQITSKDGIKIITDPYDNSIGYKLGSIDGDIVLSSHDHFDHNYTKRVDGQPVVVNTQGDKNVKGISIKGLPCFHDKSEGKERGTNIIFKLTVDLLDVCHLGDLGHTLTQNEVSSIGNVDILLLPDGGVFTIDAKEATDVAGQIKAKIVIPMHYKTKDLTFSIDDVEGFLQGKTNVKRLNVNEVEITKENLPTTEEIWVLNY